MKRFLSILLAILMLAVMLPVTAMAAGNTVKVGGTEYGTLEAAIAAARAAYDALSDAEKAAVTNYDR